MADQSHPAWVYLSGALVASTGNSVWRGASGPITTHRRDGEPCMGAMARYEAYNAGESWIEPLQLGWPLGLG